MLLRGATIWRMSATPRGAASPESDTYRDGTMSMLEHLDELRSRLIRACLALTGGMAVSFFFVDRIEQIVLAPTFAVLPPGTTLGAYKPGEGFAFYFDLAFIGGAILSAPFVLYQVWRFIAPGLYSRERRLAIPLVLCASAGTIAGALFAHLLLFPSTMAFFARFDSELIRWTPSVHETFHLYKGMLLGMVGVFQLPTLVLFLARLRLVTARFLWRHIRYAVLAAFVLAAVLTASPDPWNQAFFAAPILAMYVLSIGIAWLAYPRGEDTDAERTGAAGLVIGAAVFQQARRRRRLRQVACRTIVHRNA